MNAGYLQGIYMVLKSVLAGTHFIAGVCTCFLRRYTWVYLQNTFGNHALFLPCAAPQLGLMSNVPGLGCNVHKTKTSFVERTQVWNVLIWIKRTWDKGHRSDFERRTDNDQEVHLVLVLLHGSVEHFRKILAKENNVRFHYCQRNVRTARTTRNNLKDKFKVLQESIWFKNKNNFNHNFYFFI